VVFDEVARGLTEGVGQSLLMLDAHPRLRRLVVADDVATSCPLAVEF
jgi:hypothetical protein